ncbi:MAG TPA: aminotransferase class V-fold PLP-dependent enzyme [Candidatus Sulfopaludibacter sp.]|jgi:glutamate/tyrosine decarboxylase-like PLP-dependent enzyme|nr:aminotransferase class V-fold PLP-dependent enzyme [Candidatus Sulfopaludibacter sp.]
MDKLILSPDEIRTLGLAAVEQIAAYYDTLADRPVMVPTTSAALRALLDEPLPRDGTDFDSLLKTLDTVIAGYSRHSAHPRFFGYISSPGTPVTSVGSMLASALNINVTCWRSGPAATDLEHVTIDWMKQILGYPAEAGGLLVSGGSMANFAALAAARSAKAPGNVVRDGMASAGRMCAYVSSEGHFSISKAAGMLGIGEANVRSVATNARMEIDLTDLERLVQQDLQAGFRPFCVVANAGTTATGAFDPIGDLADFARRYQLWLHVDAAYGGFAALAPASRHLFARLGEADSVALDPHKWLYLPVGCGCVLYKNPATAYAAFSHAADYTRAIGLERDEAFAFWDYGPELSRPFRALDLWLLLKYVGAGRVAEAVQQNIDCARYFGELVEASNDCEMLAPVGLSVFCFRVKPRGFTGDLNALNERILVSLQRAGGSYLSNAMVNGQFALRGCVLNYRTTRRDMEILLEDVRRAYARG